MLEYFIFFLTLVSIYSILTLGLNVQWGMAGLLNIGVAGFFGIGAYTTAFLTIPASEGQFWGYGMPVIVGIFAAMVISGFLAFLIGLITIKLRSDYLAIATIGIAEIIHILFQNTEKFAGGAFGMHQIPQPFTSDNGLSFLIFTMVVLLICIIILNQLAKSPWGRVQIAIRDNEDAARAAGKNIMRFKLEAFILGSMLMGLGGAIYAHFFRFINPEIFDPLLTTFMVWVMLIIGGSGSIRGAILGSWIIWTLWSSAEFIITKLNIDPDIATQAAAVRPILVGLILIFILIFRKEGIIPEVRNQKSEIRS